MKEEVAYWAFKVAQWVWAQPPVLWAPPSTSSSVVLPSIIKVRRAAGHVTQQQLMLLMAIIPPGSGPGPTTVLSPQVDPPGEAEEVDAVSVGGLRVRPLHHQAVSLHPGQTRLPQLWWVQAAKNEEQLQNWKVSIIFENIQLYVTRHIFQVVFFLSLTQRC